MMMIPLGIQTSLDSTRRNETICLGMAAAVHALLFLWNPVLLSSHFKPVHDFVTVDVVETPTPGGGDSAPAPKKSGIMDTLKTMLMKPKAEEIAHIAPEPMAQRVAAPIQPMLKERSMPRPIAQTFQPKSQMEDLAAANTPNAIQTQNRNVVLPTGGPTLQSKAFGGIRTKDLPFQVSSDQNIAGGVSSVIPVAVGNKSAKSALNYGGSSLQDAGKMRVGIQPVGGGNAEEGALGGGGPSTIQISGTGGTGNAPTGATSGSVLQDRAGSGGGGGWGRGFGSGRGNGIGSGTGISGIPSAAAELDSQIGTASTGGGKRGGGPKKSFEIAGPLNNRPIVHKVIPQYPAWAEEQGIIGSVRLYFTVTPDGVVRTNIRVTKTTGYPQLDQLGIDALKQWRFAPLNAADEGKGEWGIITFNFSLSS